VIVIGGRQMGIGLVLLRLVVGLTLAAHGSQKLFGWFGGGGVDGTARGMEQLGFASGRRSAVMAGLAEAGGGILLALGAATPLAAAVLLGVMVVAVVSVHLKQGFFVMQGGYEYPLVLALAALSLAFTGPGPLSVDALAGLQLSGEGWGAVALFVGLAGAGIQLASRRSIAAEPQAQSAA
jgi:putative oxidoreductase